MILISMVDYVLKQEVGDLCYKKIINYAKLLKKPLELWMFVPCGEDGNVLIEPIEQNPIYWSREYQKAKERCLFEFNSEFLSFDNYDIDRSNVEDLLFDDLEYILTQTAIKQIS